MKLCRSCQQEKPDDTYYVSHGELMATCKDCYNQRRRDRYHADADRRARIIDQTLAWYRRQKQLDHK